MSSVVRAGPAVGKVIPDPHGSPTAFEFAGETDITNLIERS